MDWVEEDGDSFTAEAVAAWIVKGDLTWRVC
jgi:hypothetical protein